MNKTNKKIIAILTLMLISFSTNMVFAADVGQYSTTDVCKNVSLTSIGNFFNFLSCTLIKSVAPFLISLATVAFVYGIIQYFLNPDNEEKRKKGKSYMMWGIIALFVIVSVWGLVGILSNTFLGGKTLIPQLSQ